MPGGRQHWLPRKPNWPGSKLRWTPSGCTGRQEPQHKLLDNGDPHFVNPKEKLYDRFPLSVHQMDILIGVLLGLIVLFLFLGINHISFFGLFGG